MNFFLYIAVLGALLALPTAAESAARDWLPDPHYDFLESDVCTVEQIAAEDFSIDDFLVHYADRRPVVVRGYASLLPAGAWDAVLSALRRPALLAAHGQDPVTLSSGNSYSHDRAETSLAAYAEDMMAPQPLEREGNTTWYFFGDPHVHAWDDILALYTPVPRRLTPEREPALSFGAAASGTGVPFHTHGAVFAEVFYGRKRWWLAPPDASLTFDPNRSTLQWLREARPALPPAEEALLTECVCEPGDLLYIPAQWLHATLNIGETVFMSTFL